MKNNSLKIITLSLIALITSYSCDDNSGGNNEDDILLGATITAEMGSSLANQVYVDLSEGKHTVVAVNQWEIAFEKNGSAIKTNTAKKVGVAIAEGTTFTDLSSDDGLVYAYDSEDGDLSKTALAGWTTDQPYVIDLGVDENGNALGKKKFVITGSSTSGVSITFADLDGTSEVSKTVASGEGNFTFFSLMNDETVTIEPAEWDLVLTAVSVRTGAPCAVLGGGAMPGINCDIYRLSASALTNSYNSVEVAKDDPHEDLDQTDDPDSEKNKQTIESSNYDTLTEANFFSIGASTDANIMGRTWLQILTPHSAGVYKVYDFITYLVEDTDDNIYKLRFLAYKGGDNAENGNPTFEYMRISE